MVIQILVTILIVLIILPSIYNSYRKNSIAILGTIIWATFWIVGLAIIWFPHIIELIGNILGVGRSIDGLVYISIILLLYLTLNQKIKSNEIEKDITMLSRRIALKDLENKRR